ncbi:uncharacterized protein LOC127161227 [Labeo rohita]|uniref:uncharacterized protein LOC127161227 n=1 Tax=Labeo rohita TaxID=84645 RepID=UPI0021E31A2A|nr:uncharacterized protein LOC127161227 [Labeo rohita]
MPVLTTDSSPRMMSHYRTKQQITLELELQMTSDQVRELTTTPTTKEFLSLLHLPAPSTYSSNEPALSIPPTSSKAPHSASAQNLPKLSAPPWLPKLPDPPWWTSTAKISQPESRTYMVHERDSDKNIIKRYQAISSDYSNSGYDRGLLNPNSFHCEESRKATFTLTNAAPIDAGFNRIHWKNWESALRSFLRSRLDGDGGSAAVFTVTGTVSQVKKNSQQVPGDDAQIPQRGTSEDPERVTVPSHIWTAVCYKHHLNDSKSFSFGYIGKNQPEGDISLMRVSDLDDQLSRLYSELLKTPQLIRIFVDNCFDDSKKLNEIQGVFDKLINLLANQGDQMATDVKNMSHTLKKVVRSSLHPYLTVSGYWCRNNHPCGTYGKDYYWCWTTSSFLYFFSRWDYCSPPLEGSRAKNGQYCQSNYACSTYGKGYKWCYTENGSSELCCTSDDCHSAVYDKTCWKNHPCGFHGYNYLWCYTDKKAKWQYCCKDCGQ